MPHWGIKKEKNYVTTKIVHAIEMPVQILFIYLLWGGEGWGLHVKSESYGK